MTVVAVSIALLERNGRFFLQRRPRNVRHFPLQWEFPGGKVESGETPLDALIRELREELEWSPSAIEALPEHRHAYPWFDVQLHPFLCKGSHVPQTDLAWGWFEIDEILHLPIPEATRTLVTGAMGGCVRGRIPVTGSMDSRKPVQECL